MAGSSFNLLKTRRFLPLFLTQFGGAFNDNLFRAALIMLITYKLAEQVAVAPAILNNIAIALFILPYFLFSALAGELADKFEKSQQVIWIKLWEIGLMILGAIGFFTENIYILITILAGLGLQSTFFGPIKYGILPDHMTRDELLGANALVEAGTFIAILLGTIIGGLVVLSDNGALSISVLTIGIAVIGTATARYIPKTQLAAPDLTITKNIFRSTGRMLKIAWASPVSKPSILGISWIWALGSIFLTQIPVLTKSLLGGDETVVTLFLCCFSIGVGAGSILCDKLLKGAISARLAKPCLIAVALFCTIFYMVLPDAPSTAEHINVEQFLANIEGWLLLGLLLIIAGFAGVVIVPLYAILQDRTPTEYRSRIMATTNIVNSGFMAAASGLAAIALSLGVTTAQVLLVFGLGGLMFLPTMKRLDQELIYQANSEKVKEST